MVEHLIVAVVAHLIARLIEAGLNSGRQGFAALGAEGSRFVAARFRGREKHELS